MSGNPSPPPLWWQTGVVYQIYPRSFADANGDGIGDLEGVRARLDHLAWLGVDAIWMAPFYRSPIADFGEEIGMVNVPVPTDASQDPWERNEPGQGRDPERTPMQWDASATAGFCAADVKPWLPLADDHQSVNVAAQTDDPASMLTLTRRLLALRREHPALALGGYRPVDDVPDGCFAFPRQTDDAEVLVALNFTAEPLSLPLELSGPVLISTHCDRDGTPVIGPSLELRPNEALVLDVVLLRPGELPRKGSARSPLSRL